MSNPKLRRRPPLLRSLPHFLPALAAVALAAFVTSSLALLPLLLANTLCMAAMCHAIGFDSEPSFLRTALRRGPIHLILFAAYTAIVFGLVAWPLLALSSAPSLVATLELCAALIVALALLWRLWPVFGLVFLWDDAFPQDQQHSWISTAFARSIAFAWHLTGAREHFFSRFLPAGIAYLALAFGALALTGVGSLLPDELRTAALFVYAAMMLPLCTLIAANRTLRALLCETWRERKTARQHEETAPAVTTQPPAPSPAVQVEPAIEPAAPAVPLAVLNQSLLDAAREGQVERALELLQQGAEPDALPAPGARDQRSALVLAALLPDTRLLRALIARGAQVNRAHGDATALLAATRDSYHGRSEAVMTLLANGADPRLVDRDGNTPLHHGALAAEPSIAAILIDAQAPLDALNRNRHSPLASAAGAGNWALVKFLLERGAKLEPAQGVPALLTASAIPDDDPRGVQMLLKHKARVDATDALGRTALMNAALEGHQTIVRALLDAGANADLADRHGVTALMEAARAGAHAALNELVAAQADARAREEHGRDALTLACQSPRANTQCVRALLALGADPKARGADGRSALDHAAQAGRWDLVALLDPATPLPSSHALAAQPEPGADTPAHLLDALRFGHWAVASGFAERARAWPKAELAALYLDLAEGDHGQAHRWLLQHGLDAEARLDDGMRLFDALCDRLPGSIAAIESLLEAGATPAGAGGFARALARLADVDRSAFALALLERGADLFGADAQGRTPLHHAACANLAPVLDALLARGVDPNARDRSGATPLHVALDAGRAALPLARALVANGAAPERAAANGETPLGLALARGDGALEHWLRWHGWPLPQRPLRAGDLPVAAAAGDADAVSKLLALGFDVNTRDEQGASALLRACGAGHAEVAQRLLDAGADRELAAASGATPLSAAVSARRDAVVEQLLDHGARADTRLPNEATALMVAAALGFPEIAERLLARGADATLADAAGHTPLHAAARFCFESRDSLRCRRLLDVLLKAPGMQADAVDKQGASALLLLLGAQSRPDARVDDTHLGALLPALLDASADPGLADQRGVTALHACAMHALFAPARVLLARGASRDSVDAFGRNPADVARLLGLVDMALEIAPRILPATNQVLRQSAPAAD
ncbi:MAG TPA: ankyrin repeat domain-containing protein [Rhodanobacteraceae bacterium]|nr:ankyrin repeat domain-containing protein [Rhodanobacteraceae bacterium]